MAALSKEEYLKRYLSNSDSGAKKKRKKKVKAGTKAGRSLIIDDDVNLSDIKVKQDAESHGNLLEVAEDKPLIYDEAGSTVLSKDLETIKRNEEAKKAMWAPVRDITEEERLPSSLDRLQEKSDRCPVDQSPPRRKNRHDSEDESPLKRRTRHDSADMSPPRRQAPHNSEDISPPRRQTRHDSEDISPPRRRTRHDSEDMSPPRRQAPHNSGNISPPKRQTRHDSEDISPPRQRTRHDSEDISPPRRQTRHNSKDKSPPRRQTPHGSKDTSPPRRQTRHDSVEISPPRKSRHDSAEISPPRKSRHDSSSDQSPPRRNKAGHGLPGVSAVEKTRHIRGSGDQSPPRRQGNLERSRHDTPGRLPPQQKISKNLGSDVSSKREAGLSLKQDEPTKQERKSGLHSGAELRRENEVTKRRENEMFSRMSSSATGKGAETVHRDKKGKKRDFIEEKAKKKEEERKKTEEDEKFMEWGKGVQQTKQAKEKVHDDVYEMSKPLARYKDDEDLDAMMRDRDRSGDPMLAFLQKKKVQQDAVSGKKEKPKYKGPAPPPNRFNIPPGYRWDGVERSNGFEKKRFAMLANKGATRQEAYKWSTEDM